MEHTEKQANKMMSPRTVGFLVVLSLILLGGMAALAHAQSTGVGDYSGELYHLIDIPQVSTLPQTIHSGDVVSVAVDVKNIGTDITAQDLNASIDLGDQFEPIQTTAQVDQIIPGATKTLIFKFRVKPGTLPGHYSALVSFSYDRSGVIVSEKNSIVIVVAGAQKDVQITLDPRVLNPGNQTDVAFTLKNVGESPISNVSFSWKEASALILPVGSDNERFIPLIAAGESTTANYTIAADPNITTGIYPLDIDLQFTDNNGTQHQQSQIGIIIGGATDFEVSAEVVNSQLSVSIANVGSNNAGAVVAKLILPGMRSGTAGTTSILGNLNKGDFTIATFQLGNLFGANGTGAGANAAGTTGFGNNSTTNAPAAGTGNGFFGGNNPAGTTGSGFQGRRAANGDVNAGTNATGARMAQVEISYTDTTGERQTVQKSIIINASAAGLAGAAGTRTRSTGVDPLLAWGALVLIVGGSALYNHFRAKKKWAEWIKWNGVAAVVILIALFVFNRADWAIALGVIIALACVFGFFHPEWVQKIRTRIAAMTNKKTEKGRA